MKKTLIALAAITGFAAAGFAVSPASAAPLAQKAFAYSAQQLGTQIEEVRHRRGVRRHVRRSFWAPGPWAFRGIPYHHCFRVPRGGYVCYF